MSLPLGYEGVDAPRPTCGAQQMERPALFDLPDCSIKDPPSANFQSPCSDCDFRRIDKYVERARALKGASSAICRCLLLIYHPSAAAQAAAQALTSARKQTNVYKPHAMDLYVNGMFLSTPSSLRAL